MEKPFLFLTLCQSYKKPVYYTGVPFSICHPWGKIGIICFSLECVCDVCLDLYSQEDIFLFGILYVFTFPFVLQRWKWGLQGLCLDTV